MALDWEQLCKDFQQKYEETFCFVKIEGAEPELCLIKEVESTGKAPAIHIFSERIGDILLKYDTSYSDIEFRYPEVGLFSYEKQVYYVNKLYNRQWKKGPGFQTIRLTNLYNDWGFPTLPITIATLTAAFQPRTLVSIEEGLSKLRGDKCLSVPLSHEFAIGLSSFRSRNPILWYMSNPIGIVDEDRRQIAFKERSFYQEFKDYLNKAPSTRYAFAE